MARTLPSGQVIMCIQVEETFMQHVVRHWQGSLTEADSTAAMQADAEFNQGGLNGLTAPGAADPMVVRSHTTQFSDDGERCCLMHSDCVTSHNSCGPESTIECQGLVCCCLRPHNALVHQCNHPRVDRFITVVHARISDMKTALQASSVRNWALLHR